jgi:predicted CXXCH cytochrome family protein
LNPACVSRLRSDAYVLETSVQINVGGTTPRRIALPALGLLAVALALAPAAAPAQQVPLPPPPAGTKRIPLPPPPPGTSLQPQKQPAAAPGAERCTGCHAKVTQGRVMHGALEKHECTSCHRAVTAEAGKCRSRTSSKWALVRTEPELCYGCHARKDEQKVVHTVIRQGSCLSCHAAHSSDFPGLITAPREKVCLECHEVEPLLTKAVKHAPVTEGRCLDCHDAHGGNLPNNVKAESGSAFCLKCHEAKAPGGKGTPGPAFRIDMGKKVVHGAFKRTDCLGCHEGGHSSDNLRMLKKNAVDLCYGCHERKDKNKFPHGAVVLGDCAVCHDPHTSDNPKLVAKATTQENCFLCHQDDLTGRRVIHAPVAKGCEQCHDPHGAQNRFGLVGGMGKAACYKCHKPLDTGKNKHAALERYGCTGCHDPHGASRGALLAEKVNALCTRCHPREQDGRHVTPIAANGHPVGGDLNDPRRAGRDFTCASCHDPHGSDNPRLFYFGATPMESCDGCHGDKSGKRPELKSVISRAKRKPSDQGAAGAGSPGSGAPGAGAPGGGSPGSGAGAGGAPGSGAGAGGGAPGPGSGGGEPGSAPVAPGASR